MTFQLFSGNLFELLESHLSSPRNVNNVSYVTRINHESHFSWQEQYLVMLEGDSCCSVHCTRRFMCDVFQRSFKETKSSVKSQFSQVTVQSS